MTKDLVAHVEATYRVVPGRRGARCSASRWAATRRCTSRSRSPGSSAAVATHSAMLLERIPSADQGAGRWHMAAFNAVFGDPIDAALWAENDPLAWARKVDPKAAPALYFDCGAEDRYGLASGHRDAARDPRRAAGPAHASSCRPGDHGYEFVRAAARDEPALPRRAPCEP